MNCQTCGYLVNELYKSFEKDICLKCYKKENEKDILKNLQDIIRSMEF